MDMDAYDLGTPAVVPVRVNDGEAILVSLYEANDKINELASTDDLDPDHYWEGIRNYVSEKLEVSPDQLDLGQLGRFVDLIVAAVACAEDDRKKKREQIASSLQRIREFRESTFTGTNGENETGSTTSHTSEPRSKHNTPTTTPLPTEDTSPT